MVIEQSMFAEDIFSGSAIGSCINIDDSHCHVFSTGRCKGKTCEFYEPKNTPTRNSLDDYRTPSADFAMFSSVTGPLLEPDCNPVALGLS